MYLPRIAHQIWYDQIYSKMKKEINYIILVVFGTSLSFSFITCKMWPTTPISRAIVKMILKCVDIGTE